MKRKIVDILKKEELSVYDCGTIFKYMGELFQDLTKSIMLVPLNAVYDAEAMIERVTEIISTMERYDKKIDYMNNKVLQKMEEAFTKFYERQKFINKKIEEIPVSYPHGLEDLMRIAEQVSKYDDNTFDKLIALAKALRKGE